MSPHLCLRHVHVTRAAGGRALPVLAGIDLEVAPGQVAAIVGPSGCGKSTLLDVAAGLLAPEAGTALVDGRAVRPGDLALLPQRDALIPSRTVQANIALAARLAGAGRGAADQAARRAVAEVGLAGFEEHYPDALSGGMRQRAALARTMVSGRRGWLLDEPFGALDALTRLEMQALLARLWAAEAPTVLLVTHDLDEALTLADLVAVVGPRPGRVTRVVEVPEPRPRDPAAPPAGHAGRRAEIVSALRAGGGLA
jgi:NitT/TauT family transport system ATP-binding protein